MPKLAFKKACSDCPYRRKSLPGWLGSGDTDHFIRGALADTAEYDLPCHQTIDYEDKDWLTTQYPDSALCAGALIFARNQMKSPHDPQRAANVKAVEQDHERVFSWPHEFKAHHNRTEI